VTIASRKLCLVVLLGLLVGHASIALHTAAHSTSDAGDCEICVSYGNLSKAISANPGGLLSPSTPVFYAAPIRISLGLPARLPARQR
jgi:hypothetical protein